MGCDIHIVLERKNRETGEWVGIRDMAYINTKLLSVYGEQFPGNASFVSFKLKNRHYEFFWQLAGVRDGDGPEGEAKGLPQDMSSLSRLMLEDDADYHSHSYTSARELALVLARCKYDDAKLAELVAGSLEGSEEAMAKVLQEWLDDDVGWAPIDDWRIVYAFDN